MTVRKCLVACLLLAAALVACEEDEKGSTGTGTPAARVTATVVAATDVPNTPTMRATKSPTVVAGNKSNDDRATREPRKGPRKIVDEYEVEPGDTLREIAQKYYGDELLWPLIWDYNKARAKQMGQEMVDPDLIYPDWKFLIPRREKETA